MLQWRSLKTRVTFFTLVIFILSIWFVVFYASRMLREDMQRLLGEQQFTTVSFIADGINHELEERLDALKRVANGAGAAMQGKPAAMQTLLEQRPLLLNLFNGGVFATGLDGTAVADVPLSAGRVGTIYMDKSSVSVSLKEGRALIGPPTMSDKLPAPIFSLSVPIHDPNGKVIGALVGTINLGIPNFLDMIAHERYGQTGGYLLIAPQHNLFVTASDKSRIMQPLPAKGANPMHDKYMQGYEGYGVATNSRGVPELSAAKAIAAAGWFVVALIPTEEAFAPIRNMQQRMLAATIFLTLLVGGLTWWMVAGVLRRQLAPMLAASRTLANLPDSNQRPKPIAVTTADEVGDLIGGFNRLLSALGEREDALKDSEARMRTILNTALDAVIGIDSQGLITAWNLRAETIFGWNQQEAIGRAMADMIIPEQHRTAHRNGMARFLLTGEERILNRRIEITALHRSGNQFPIELAITPLRVGNTCHFTAFIADITERLQAQTKMAESEDRFRTLIEWSPTAIGVHSNGLFVYINPAAIKIFGASSAQDLLGTPVLDRVHPDFCDVVLERIKRSIHDGVDAPSRDMKFIKLDGTVIDVEVQGTKIIYAGVPSIRFALRDVSQRNLDFAELRIAATAFDTQQGMTITCSDRLMLRVNKAFTQITGYSAEEAVGQNPRLLSSGRHDAAFYAVLWEGIARDGTWQGEIWNRRKNGEVYPEWLTITAVKDDCGLVTNYVAIFSDITARKTAEDQIESLAFFDPLTGLPNRRLLLDRLAQVMTASARHQRKNALLFVDLDNFKTLNDTLGHYQGDLLLEQVAKRLITCVREGDTVARLGGDEFVVMLEDLSENELEAATQAETVGGKILDKLNQNFQLENQLHRCTPSIGVALFGSGQEEKVDEPLKRAELAMFQAKASGRNNLRFFDPKMQADVTTRAVLEADLREALVKNQFLLHYQAQVVGEGCLTGAEVLVRWQHPLRGLVSPLEFISLAEDTGLILPLGQWVLETACTQLAAWGNRPEMAHLTISVNVSARQFHHKNFVADVLTVLQQTGANPRRLKLELTESLLVNDLEGIIDKMNELKTKGVGFSLDDFGTGYSSLSYLKRLPLDQLKIDQSFVRNIVTDPNDAAIAKMVVALAQSMGLSVIAEGVEILEQRDFLAQQGCLAYQGYFFSRPLTLEAFQEFALRAIL